MKKYYEAYEDRYRVVHAKGVTWFGKECTKIVMETIQNYKIASRDKILEIGCGEGRDARIVLDAGYDLLATDISSTAIEYCKKLCPQFESKFRVVDCLKEQLAEHYDYIYAIAVLHMLVLDQDRDKFYQFIRNQLKMNGVALICTMGDGKVEMQSDISKAFVLQEREHETGKMMVAGTSCRMVSFQTLEQEIERNELEIIEKGITEAMPDFNSLMYVVVKRK